MKKQAKFSERLAFLMGYRNISKSELARICGIDKSNITRYCKGEYEAKQDVIYTLATKLKVNAAWLMGYDVPMDAGDRAPEEIHEDGSRDYINSLIDGLTPENRAIAIDLLKALQPKESAPGTRPGSD